MLPVAGDFVGKPYLKSCRILLYRWKIHLIYIYKIQNMCSSELGKGKKKKMGWLVRMTQLIAHTFPSLIDAFSFICLTQLVNHY